MVPGSAHDDVLVGHRGHVGAAGGAHPEHHRHLRNGERGHHRLVVEDPPEVLLVGKDLRLERQEDAARVHQIDRRQAILERDLLRPDVLLERLREVGAALHRRIVGDDHALASGDEPDPGHDAGRWNLAAVETVRGQGRELEERALGVDQALDPLAGEELAPLPMEGHCRFRATALDGGEVGAELIGQGAMMAGVGAELGGLRGDLGAQRIHGRRFSRAGRFGQSETMVGARDTGVCTPLSKILQIRFC